jgi:uncharacterized protein
MRDIFKRLGIQVDEVNMTQVEAFEKLKTGEIAATVLIAGKPAHSMSKLTSADGFHFLSLPFSSALASDYLPATLTHDDYPEMIAPDRFVETIATTAALISYNWQKDTDRYRRVKTFVEAFFPRIAEFHNPPRHVKWREVNLAAKLPGWNRFEPAETWLNSISTTNQASRETVYQDFLRWMRSRQHD